MSDGHDEAWENYDARLPGEDEEEPEVAEPCKPFCRWVGSKIQLLPVLREWMPKRFSLYAEPFVGGGALFFNTRPRHATLSDTNRRLIRTYLAVKNDVDAVITGLRIYADGYARCLATGTAEQLYYHVRGIEPDTMSDADLAAWFIFLNKTNFNGIYRVNKAGKMNTPYGHRKNPLICDETTLRACSEALQRATIVHRDFRETNLPPTSFCYFDCPYAPLSATSDFTSYTAEGFTAQDQKDLRDLALRLKSRGVYVLLSNSSAPLIRELYKDGFEIREVQARRNVNADASGRGAVTELMIR
ncbi:MAG TPA: DNA adenine methylase [Vicinamibacterales bacterium]|nr:DNA adenine methylase [Vicinamibacterales bacterium]